jgi:hypothetical protein
MGGKRSWVEEGAAVLQQIPKAKEQARGIPAQKQRERSPGGMDNMLTSQARLEATLLPCRGFWQIALPCR